MLRTPLGSLLPRAPLDLPPGAVGLASSAVFPNQAFRWGRQAYGIQFHLEVSKELAESFALPKPAGALVNAVEKGGPAE